MGVVGAAFGLLFYCVKLTIFFASFLASIMVSAAFLASAYVLSSIYLSKMSSSGSIVSSWIDSMVVYCVFLLTGIAEVSFCMCALS